MELTTRTFSQFIELCLPRFGFPNINGNRRYPVRGETIDNEFEISSEHEKVYINILFSKKFEAVFKNNKNVGLLRQNVIYITAT